jgi:hypothetical protein
MVFVPLSEDFSLEIHFASDQMFKMLLMNGLKNIPG